MRGDPITAGISPGSDVRRGPPLSTGERLILLALALYCTMLACVTIQHRHTLLPHAPPSFQMYVTPQPFPVKGPHVYGPPYLVHKWEWFAIPEYRPYRFIELYYNPDGTFWLYLHSPIRP